MSTILKNCFKCLFTTNGKLTKKIKVVKNGSTLTSVQDWQQRWLLHNMFMSCVRIWKFFLWREGVLKHHCQHWTNTRGAARDHFILHHHCHHHHHHNHGHHENDKRGATLSLLWKWNALLRPPATIYKSM